MLFRSTEKELEILREFYPSGGYKACQEKGVEKTMYAITSQATLMGLGRNIPGNESVEVLVGKQAIMQLQNVLIL